MGNQRGRRPGGWGGGNRSPDFTEAEITNLLNIMGEVVPIGPLEWGVMAKQHKELFGTRNQYVTSLWCKFSMVANMTSPAGDPNIPGYVALAKDVMWSIEIRMDLGEVGAGGLGIEDMAEFEEDTQGDEGSNLLEEFQLNKDE